VSISANSIQTTAKIQLINGGDGIVFRDSLMQTAIFTADRQYSDASGEGKLFDWGPLWHRLNFEAPLAKGEMLTWT
jgi:hypothetical protein